MGTKRYSCWQKIRKPLKIIGIVLAGTVVMGLIVAIIGGYLFNWDWVGFGPYSPPMKDSNFQRGKTLWDWFQLLFIPVVLTIGGFWLNQIQKNREEKTTEQRAKIERKAAEKRAKTEYKIAQDNQREAALKEYFEKISELLLHENLRHSDPDAEVRKIARVWTLTVLPRLDGGRKRSLLQFLHESGLIEKDKSVIDLQGSDLSRANLQEAYLRSINLSRANLQEADLRGADLCEADLSRAYLSGAKLNLAKLQGSDLSGAQLGPTNLFGANLHGATLNVTDLFEVGFEPACLRATNLRGANLSGAKLARVTLWNAQLSGANLSGAYLYGANLWEARLDGAELREADLCEANLGRADLSGAKVTQEQLDKAKSLQGTIMQDSSIHP